MQEMGYEGGGQIWDLWWRYTAADAQMRDTLKDILADAWVRRRQEYGRHGCKRVSREHTTESDGRRRGRGIRHGRRSSDSRTPWRDNAGSVFWDRYGGRLGGRTILCGGETVGVGGQGRRRTLP